MMMGPGGTKPTAKAPAPPAGDLGGSLEALRNALKLEIDTGQIKLRMERRGLVISLREAAFFRSGDDSIYPGTFASIDKIAATIAPLPNLVRLEGHTDALPIHNSRFRSNWELSAARAIAMLELLATRGTVTRGRMAVAGYAETVPVEGNDTEEGRAHNRRVDIVILNENGARAEPGSRRPAARQPMSLAIWSPWPGGVCVFIRADRRGCTSSPTRRQGHPAGDAGKA